MQETEKTETYSSDGRETKNAKVPLEYPYSSEDAPQPGKVKEISEGVFWIRMPLPISLEWINLWLLKEDDGWTIVDTGMAVENSREHWRTIFDTVLNSLPVKRVIVTHMHPDHIGLAGWISRKFDAKLVMSRLEYMNCRMLVADTGRNAPEAGIRFFREAGWNDDQIETYRSKFGQFGKMVSRLPDSYERLEDGDVIDIGGSDWRVIVGSGHSPEHVCLFNQAKNLLIAGDQLLPRISSNVSVHPTEPEADPLKDWLESCDYLKSETPADVLVLPAHNLPFRGAHKRLQSLIDGHEKGLSRLLSRLSVPKTVTECFGALFARKITDDILSLATGETIAHLNCLMKRGQVERSLGEDGRSRYKAI